MLKLVSGNKLIIGITRGNIAELEKGRPLAFSAHHGKVLFALTAGIEMIAIHFRETPEELIDEMSEFFPQLLPNREEHIRALKTPTQN